jgi:Tat protein translocase TatC
MWKAVISKLFKAREKFALNLAGPDEEKPFLDHLEDLRKMFVRIALTLCIATFGAFGFYKNLFEFIKLPLWWSGIVKTPEQMANMLKVLTPQDGFMMTMNISLVAAIIVAFPLLLLFLLQFILPGLKDNEKKLIFPAIAVGAGLFLIGATFAYFIVLPKTLAFFASFNADLGFGNDWRVNEYVKFATRFVLLFGVAFELPVIVMVLVKLEILSFKLMNTTRSYAVVAIAIFSALVTPTPDPFTMMVMAAPLYILYEACIWIAWFMNKKDREAYPEYYAQLEKEEAAQLEDEKTSSWDTDEFNPWSSGDDDDSDDEETLRPKPASGTVSTSGTTPSSTDKPQLEPLSDDAPSEKKPHSDGRYDNED